MGVQAPLAAPAGVFIAPSNGAIWHGPSQLAALNHLFGHGRVKVLLGAASSGKSAILNHFEHTVEHAVVLRLAGPQTSAAGVLAALFVAAELQPWSSAEADQRNLLCIFFDQCNALGKRVVICVDGANKFSGEAWSEIERLCLMPYGGRSMAELVIISRSADASQVPLSGLLNDSATCPIDAVHFLPSPSDHDIAGYITWQIEQLGNGSRFSNDAYRLISSLAQGRFDLVNKLCGAILSHQASEGADHIDAGVVHDAVGKLGPAPKPGRLILTINGKTLRTVDLKGRLIIGRGNDSDIRLESRHLSRHHAVILPSVEGHYFIVDLNGANSMLVNGEFMNRSFLCHGDVVALGQFRLTVDLQKPQVKPAKRGGSGDPIDVDVRPATIATGSPCMRIVGR